jgi:hypothetical protein
VVAGSHQRKLVGDFGVQREQFGNLHLGRRGLQRLKGSADLGRRFRLHIKRIEMAGCAEIEDENTGAIVALWIDGTLLFRCQQLRQSQADGSQRSNFQHVPPRHAVAGLCFPSAYQIQHARISR